MKKSATNKTSIFQLIAIPFLFVHYLVSFVLAARLRFLFDPERKNAKNRQFPKAEDDQIDPQLMNVVDGLKQQSHAGISQV